MEILKLMKTVYVFSKEKLLIATLKEQSDKTLKVLSCSIKLEELEEFLKETGYKMA